jgi:periplasmic protein TonB
MRIAPVVALIASTAFHAGVLMYVPGTFNSHDAAAPDATTPGIVIVAHLKNTLDSDQEARPRASSGNGSAPGAAAEARKPRLDNPMHFYPPEAVARGIEGETILILKYTADGRLVDARIAKSSGHAILDQAALRAVRATPRVGEGPREILFPVTFALH